MAGAVTPANALIRNCIAASMRKLTNVNAAVIIDNNGDAIMNS